MPRWSLSLLLLPLALAAQPTTPSVPVTIEADRMELDQRQGTSRYTGHVILSRGALQIRADRITLHSPGGKLQRAEVEGNPATLIREGQGDSPPLRAEAARMEYRPQEELVELRGAARLWHGANQFSGEQIKYDLGQQVVKASGAGEEGGRIKVLIQPQVNDGKPKEEP